MIVLTVVLVLAAVLLIPVYTHHGDEVSVPKITGLPQNVAEKKLEEVGLELHVADTVWVKTLAPLTVVDQELKPGRKVKPGRYVYVTINGDGPRKVTLPDVVDNCSMREAIAKLKLMGLTVSRIDSIPGDPDWVYGIKVNGRNTVRGTKIPVDAAITLVVGAGRGDEGADGAEETLDSLVFTDGTAVGQ